MKEGGAYFSQDKFVLEFSLFLEKERAVPVVEGGK